MTTCTEELLQGIIFATDGIIPASEATKGNIELDIEVTEGNSMRHHLHAGSKY